MPEPTERLRRLSYDDFALRLEHRGAGRAVAQIEHATGGGGSTEVALPMPADEIEELLRGLETSVPGVAEEDGARGTIDPATVQEAGEALFGALVRGRVRDSFFRSRGHLDEAGRRGLRLRLVFDLEAEGTLPLAALPWELLHDGGNPGFLARQPSTPLVRYLETGRPSVLPPFEPPLGILCAFAQPGLGPRLDLGAEERRIRAAWRARPEVRIEAMRVSSAGKLRERLEAGGFQILHFMGHGTFDPETGEGTLELEQPDGSLRRVSGRELGTQLADLPALRLAVVNACDGGRLPRRDGVDPGSSVAAALVAAGVPAVVAMQLPVSDAAALAFARRFYALLADDASPEQALSEARLAMADAPDAGPYEWATPVLYSRLGPGAILPAAKSGPAATRELHGKLRTRDYEHLIETKSAGFVGRRFLFDDLDRFLREAPSGYFVVTGEPGIGKSAVVAELVRTRGWIHHFNVQPIGLTHPSAFLQNVAAQLILRHGLDEPGLPPEADRDGGYLTSLLHRVSAQSGPHREPTVVLVDALDESDTSGLGGGTNPLYLPPTLPDGVFFLVTGRPMHDRLHIEGPSHPLELRAESTQNRADVEELVGDRLGRPGVRGWMAAQHLSEAEFVALMVEKSASNFMYLAHVLPAIDRGDYEDTRFDRLPSGLVGYYESQWRRMRAAGSDAWEQTLRVLGVLAALDEPVEKEDVVRYGGLAHRRAAGEALRRLRPFLTVREAPADRPGESRQKLYAIYHKSFRDFLAQREEIGELDLRLARRKILEDWLPPLGQDAAGRG